MKLLYLISLLVTIGNLVYALPLKVRSWGDGDDVGQYGRDEADGYGELGDLFRELQAKYPNIPGIKNLPNGMMVGYNRDEGYSDIVVGENGWRATGEFDKTSGKDKEVYIKHYTEQGGFDVRATGIWKGVGIIHGNQDRLYFDSKNVIFPGHDYDNAHIEVDKWLSGQPKIGNTDVTTNNLRELWPQITDIGPEVAEGEPGYDKYVEQRTAAANMRTKLESIRNRFLNSAIGRRDYYINKIGELNRDIGSRYAFIEIDDSKATIKKINPSGGVGPTGKAWVKIKNMVSRHSKPLFSVFQVGNSVDKIDSTLSLRPDSFDPNTPVCLTSSSKKRASSSCAAPITLTNGDSIEEASSDDDVSRNDIGGIIGLGNSLEIPEMGNGYTGEGIPTSLDDQTELDPEFMFSGSLTIDDAYDKIEDAFNEKIGNIKDEDTKKRIARALSTLRRGVAMRIANLKAQNGNIKYDKQITAESRSVALDRMSDKFKDTFGSTVEEMDIDEETAEVADKINSIFGPIELNGPEDFGDYRLDDDIVSINSADALDALQSAMPDEFSNTESVGSVESGSDVALDITAAVPGSMGYRDMWKTIGAKSKALLAKKGVKSWQYRHVSAATAKLAIAVQKKQESIEKKINNGLEVTNTEIQDYELLHSVTNGNIDALGKVDSVDISEIKPDLKFAETPSTLPKLVELKTYKPMSGSPRNYLSGIKAIPDSLRKFRSKLNSIRGTRRPGSSN